VIGPHVVEEDVKSFGERALQLIQNGTILVVERRVVSQPVDEVFHLFDVPRTPDDSLGAGQRGELGVWV
jgi:hypothetical protein